MAYTINLSNGNTLTVVEDGQTDLTTTSVALVGKNYSGYGEYINENFVRMVEHFANDSSPSSPLTGQLWFDTGAKELKVWNSTSWSSTSKPSVLNDTVTASPHYLTFVAQSSGSPTVKVSATKGLVFTPSTGNFGLGVLEASSKLVINAGPNTTVQPASPNTNTTIHVHSNNGSGQTVLLDSYGGTVSGGNYSVNNASVLGLRRANGTSSAVEAVRVNDYLGIIGGQGFNGGGYTTNKASIYFQATEAWSQAANGTKVVIQTTPNGTTSPVTSMSILGDKTVECQGNVTVVNNITAGGTIRANGDVVAYYTSDKHLKTNIQTIDDAINKVMTLDGVTFNWNDLAEDKDQFIREAGVIAQQVQKVQPEAVTTRDNGYLAVRYEKLVPLLIEAIKELKREINSLKAA
jgi:hypothetical protein